MWLAASSVGTRRASYGRCLAKKHGDTDRGRRWKVRGHRDTANTYGGGLKRSPELVKPRHAKQGCFCAFFYFALVQETES